MRTGSDMLKSVLHDSITPQYIADLYVGRDREATDLTLEGVNLTWDASAKVLCSGNASIVYSDDYGGTISPRSLSSWLAPYASWLVVRQRIVVGDFSETITLGRLAVGKPSNPEQARRQLDYRSISTGSRIKVNLADAFSVTDRERFALPSQPPAGTMAWDELGRLSGWPVVRSVSDKAIPSTVTYQTSRLDALFDIGKVLGGVPFMDSDNTLTIRPDEWPDVSWELKTGAEGEIVSVDIAEWDTSTVYNQVLVRAEDNDQSSILAEAHIPDGRMRYGTPAEGAWGRIPYYVYSQYVKTVEQAQAFADAQLAKVSRQTAVTATVKIIPNPLLQVGDVVTFPLDDRTYTGRITKIQTGVPMELVIACE